MLAHANSLVNTRNKLYDTKNEVNFSIMDKLTESVENYLETILILSQSGNSIHSVDIAKELEYSKPTISVAMKNLRAAGYIETDSAGHITLTPPGREIAQKIYDRHTLISDWLMRLGVDRETALRDACKMEHGMSENSFLALRRHIEAWKG